MRKRKESKIQYKMSGISSLRTELPVTEMKRLFGRAGLRKKIRTSELDTLNLRCPLDNEAMLSTQLDMTVWSSEEMNWLETGTEKVIKWYFNSQNWMRLPKEHNPWTIPIFREVKELKKN